MDDVGQQQRVLRVGFVFVVDGEGRLIEVLLSGLIVKFVSVHFYNVKNNVRRKRRREMSVFFWEREVGLGLKACDKLYK